MNRPRHGEERMLRCTIVKKRETWSNGQLVLRTFHQGNEMMLRLARTFGPKNVGWCATRLRQNVPHAVAEEIVTS